MKLKKIKEAHKMGLRVQCYCYDCYYFGNYITVSDPDWESGGSYRIHPDDLEEYNRRKKEQKTEDCTVPIKKTEHTHLHTYRFGEFEIIINKITDDEKNK